MIAKFCIKLFHFLQFIFSFSYKCVLFTFLFLLPSSYARSLDVLATTLPRDLMAIYVAVRMLLKSYYLKKCNATAYSEFRRAMLKHPDKTCFIFENDEWSFKRVDEYTSKTANAFSDLGYKKGDVVAVFVNSCPEYVCLWLGLSRLGVVASLVNVSLRGQSLKFCIETCECSAVIFSGDLAPAILNIRNDLKSAMRYFQLGGTPKEGVSNLDNFLLRAFDVFKSPETINHTDHLVYVYTSGTTGFPKAAIIPHSRFLLMGTFSTIMLGLNPSDRIYIPLPLYHTAGGLLGISMSLIAGCAGVITPKFSASNYVLDCIKHECTVAMFIGEMCRYILLQPPSHEDRAHKLRMIVSTGLRPNVWQAFKTRFCIPMVREIYGATEGNIQFANMDDKIGAVGFIPQCLPRSIRRFVGVLVKVDPETQEPIRDQNGFCVECEVDELGMLLGLIPANNVTRTFSGYLDKRESEKKVIFNVFKMGDRAFITGDLMSMDKYGYLYFKDRTGDTYRWKGENVATFEIESLLSGIIQQHECIVYGVQVGNFEGKAVMVAIVDPLHEVDVDELAMYFEKNLSKHAIPLFIRLLPHTEITGTFRLKKTQLKKDGFDPSIVNDPLYFKQGKVYVELTKDVYEAILNGAIMI
uniref:Long-chain-fatty-acid--CoA ligase n=1 Tax=Lygus hesperus TaxID=30085 RepID=A0A0K8T204_LYGHE